MKVRGSITVFSALALMLVASFLFALLESARVYGMDTWAGMKSELGLESVCAEYQSELWEGYQLLCLNGAYGGSDFSMEYVAGTLKGRIDKNLEAGEGCLFDLTLEAIEMGDYQLLTDDNGDVFLHCISEYMRQNLPMEVAEVLYEQYEESQRIEEENNVSDAVREAEDSLQEARESLQEANSPQKEANDSLQKVNDTQQTANDTQQEVAENTSGREMTSGTGQTIAESAVWEKRDDEGENLLEFVLEAKSNAVLGMVGQDTQKVSGKKLSDTDRFAQREWQKGTMEEEFDIGWDDKVLVLEYLGDSFSNYTSPSKEGALSYELEYILCGKDGDKANLEGAVNRLLLLREAANVMHIVGDAEKLRDTLLIAENTAGFTANPAIIKVVQIGIVAAWAYLESVQDVRALLEGNEIALIKNRDQWTLDLSNLLEVFSSTARAKKCEDGLSYQDYLKITLFMVKREKLAKRAMDLIEQNIRQLPDCENFRMDHMICQMSCRFLYSSEPRFLSFVTIGQNASDCYQVEKQEHFSYY